VIVYLDSSVVLRVLFGENDPWAGWGSWEAAFSSELLGVEALRVIDRLRHAGALDAEGVEHAREQLARVQAAIGLIRLTRGLLARASRPMPTPVRTLDAIHLASALLLEEQRGLALTFATHDRQQAAAARAHGLAVDGA